MTLLRLFAASAVVSSALAHLDLNYPTSTWTFDETKQEAGGVCGGGTRAAAAVAWGTEGAFVSLSGDEGHTVRVLLATANSTTANATVSSAASFTQVLSESATFSSSGNLCLPITFPAEYITGARATLYVEATGEGETVSSCAEVVLVPANSGAAPVIDHGSAVVNPATGGNYTISEYYCSNGTIAALDTCSCHCHGTSEHCDASCSSERVATAAAECAAASGTSLSSTSSAPSSTSTTPSASGSVGNAAVASTTGGTSGAGKKTVGVPLVLAAAGMAILS